MIKKKKSQQKKICLIISTKLKFETFNSGYEY